MIAIYKCWNERGYVYDSGVVYSYADLYDKTFLPMYGDYVVLDKVKGETYEDRKAFVRDTAVDYSYLTDARMGYGDLAEIGAWFEKYGRRYGLLREFHENGIC